VDCVVRMALTPRPSGSRAAARWLATHRRAQRTEVVMQAYTVQLERTAIQQKTFL